MEYAQYAHTRKTKNKPCLNNEHPRHRRRHLLYKGVSPSLLWPNLIDALYALLRAFSEPQHQGLPRQWVFGALRDDQVCAALGEEVSVCFFVFSDSFWLGVVRLKIF